MLFQRRMSLGVSALSLTALFLLLPLSLSAQEKYAAIDSIEAAFYSNRPAELVLYRPSDDTVELSYNAVNYEVADNDKLFLPQPAAGSNTVTGPRDNGFVITVQQVDQKPMAMMFQPDGISLEQTRQLSLWHEKTYGIILNNGCLIIRLDYGEDVDWGMVADMEDEILYNIDHLRMNYNPLVHH